MDDPLSPEERSEHMSKIHSRGNASTELAVEQRLEQMNVGRWVKHKEDIPGTPDFYFPEYQLALFVHGCFWHGCPHCDRNIPNSRTDFWKEKIESNKRRDRRVRRSLWNEGYHVMRIWGHKVPSDAWEKRLHRMLERIRTDDGVQ